MAAERYDPPGAPSTRTHITHKQPIGLARVAWHVLPYAGLHVGHAHKEIQMNIRLTSLLTLALLPLCLAACSSMSNRDKNTATGAVIGGAAGAILTGGSTAGTVGGAAVGGVIGHEVDPKKK
jgi:osmotically inducible lipoprotein OsmB